MSRHSGVVPTLAIEYSGRGVTVYDPQTRNTQTFADLATVGSMFSGRQTVLGLSRRSVFLRTTRVPNASPEDIRQILTLRAGELFPVGPADLAVDFRLTDDMDLEGRLAIVCGIPVVELRRIREEAKAAGIRLVGVMPVAFGAMSIARQVNHLSAAIVSRDQEGIGIDLVVNGELRQSRVVPANAQVEAEVCRTYTVAGLACGEIVAAGGVVLKDSDADTADSPLAALIDAFPAHLGIDLVLPEETELRRQKAKAQKGRSAFLLAAAASAVLIFVVKQWTDKLNDLDVRTRQESAKVTKATKAKKLADTTLTKAQSMEKTLKRAFQPGQRIGDTVALVTNLAPDGMWLAGINAERGKPITMRGTAITADAFGKYLENLNGSDRLRKVQMVFQNNGEIQKQPVVQFSVSAFPIGNLPLADPNAKIKAKTGAKK